MPVHQTQIQKEKETYARLTAPSHVTLSHFSAHQKIEGYFENRDVPDFIGSDRLLRLDSLYGTIQLGYNPRKGQSFLFANIKTSILDVAPSRYQRELKEYQMMRGRKADTQNVAYTAKRRGNSAVLLYKMENRPWTRDSIAPYLRRMNMEALRKTMPFLDREVEYTDRQRTQEQGNALAAQLRESVGQQNHGETARIRGEQLRLGVRQNELSALIYRKDTQRWLFFRRLNYALDNQKQEMFAYYRNRRLGGRQAQSDAAQLPVRDEDEVRDE